MTQLRPTAPFPMTFFEVKRPRGGARSIRITLGGLDLTLEGLGPDLATRLIDRYGPYADSQSSDPHGIRVSLSLEERDHFIEPPSAPEKNPVLLACDGERIRYLGYRLAGWFDTRGGRGEIVLASGGYEPDLGAIENYVRAAVAWQAASMGGALVHAASAVFQDRGYLFYGPSGAGKSTLSALTTRARVLSDDLSLVLPRQGAGLDLAGSPFRGTYTGGPPVIGRFPLVAGFRLVQAAQAEVRAVPRVRAFAELVANLPFVADAFPVRPDLFEKVETTFASLPLYHLHFCKNDSYWDAILAAGL